MSADFRLSVTQGAGAVFDKVIPGLKDILDFIAYMMNAAARVPFEKVFDG